MSSFKGVIFKKFKSKKRSDVMWYLPLNSTEIGPHVSFACDSDLNGYSRTILIFQLDDGTIEHVRGPYESSFTEFTLWTGRNSADEQAEYILLKELTDE